MSEEIPKEVVEAPIKFLAKKNCKKCHERGFITRTYPMAGKKQMSKHKTLCPCVTEIKTPEPDECVVPKVATDDKAKSYACVAQPLH